MRTSGKSFCFSEFALDREDSFMLHEQQYRSLGTSGILVSPLGVGTNKWMQGRNDEPVCQVAHAFLAAGGNFFDSAEVYGLGKSERLLGTCLQQHTRPVVVASKFARLYPLACHAVSLWPPWMPACAAWV